MGFAFFAGLVLVVVIGSLLSLLILLQQGRGGRFVFGQAGGHTVLGARAPEALFWLTVALFGAFLGLVVLLNVAAR